MEIKSATEIDNMHYKMTTQKSPILSQEQSIQNSSVNLTLPLSKLGPVLRYPIDRKNLLL